MNSNLNNPNNINTKENFSNFNNDENNYENNQDDNNNKEVGILTKNLFNISKTNFNTNIEFENYFTSSKGVANSKNGSIDFSNKEKLKEFIANKKKIKQRLNSMFKKTTNNYNSINSNNSVGQRVLIKNQKGLNIEDRFSNTTKVFY
jgi:ribosomal protein S18